MTTTLLNFFRFWCCGNDPIASNLTNPTNTPNNLNFVYPSYSSNDVWDEGIYECEYSDWENEFNEIKEKNLLQATFYSSILSNPMSSIDDKRICQES